jgi:hypothetical protein
MPAELLLKSFGDAEHSAEPSNVLTDEHHSLVVEHGLTQAFIERRTQRRGDYRGVCEVGDGSGSAHANDSR